MYREIKGGSNEGQRMIEKESRNRTEMAKTDLKGRVVFDWFDLMAP
jgi:hypothetical protein